MANRSLPVVLLDPAGWDFLACNICWWRIRHHGIWISSFAVCSEMIPIDESCLCCAVEALRKTHRWFHISKKHCSAQEISCEVKFSYKRCVLSYFVFSTYWYHGTIKINMNIWIIWINNSPKYTNTKTHDLMVSLSLSHSINHEALVEEVASVDLMGRAAKHAAGVAQDSYEFTVRIRRYVGSRW